MSVPIKVYLSTEEGKPIEVGCMCVPVAIEVVSDGGKVAFKLKDGALRRGVADGFACVIDNFSH